MQFAPNDVVKLHNYELVRLSSMHKTYKLQKNQKNFKKRVDKRGRKWYNIQAVAQSGTQSGGEVIEN